MVHRARALCSNVQALFPVLLVGRGEGRKVTMRHFIGKARGCHSPTSPRWGEVERSEGEGVQVSPDRTLTPHPDLTVRPLPQGEVKRRLTCRSLTTSDHPHPQGGVRKRPRITCTTQPLRSGLQQSPSGLPPPLHARFRHRFQNGRFEPLTGVRAALKPHPHRFGGPMRGRSSVG